MTNNNYLSTIKKSANGEYYFIHKKYQRRKKYTFPLMFMAKAKHEEIRRFEGYMIKKSHFPIEVKVPSWKKFLKTKLILR